MHAKACGAKFSIIQPGVCSFIDHYRDLQVPLSHGYSFAFFIIKFNHPINLWCNNGYHHFFSWMNIPLSASVNHEHWTSRMGVVQVYLMKWPKSVCEFRWHFLFVFFLIVFASWLFCAAYRQLNSHVWNKMQFKGTQSTEITSNTIRSNSHQVRKKMMYIFFKKQVKKKKKRVNTKKWDQIKKWIRNQSQESRRIDSRSASNQMMSGAL